MEVLKMVLCSLAETKCVIGTKWSNVHTGDTVELTKIDESRKLITLIYIKEAKYTTLSWELFVNNFVPWIEKETEKCPSVI